MINKQLELPMERIIAFCQQYPIRKLSLFGSVLREDFRPDSDVDMLVEFEAGASVTYLDMAQMEIDMGALLGRKIDLRTPDELSKYFRHQVLNTAVPLYERE
jgi:uncharacterized protein